MLKGESRHSGLPVWERETTLVYLWACCFVFTQSETFAFTFESNYQHPHGCSSDCAQIELGHERNLKVRVQRPCCYSNTGSQDALLLSRWPFGVTIPIVFVKTTQGFEMILLGCCEDAPDGIIIPPGGVNLPGTELRGCQWPSYTLQPANSHKLSITSTFQINSTYYFVDVLMHL